MDGGSTTVDAILADFPPLLPGKKVTLPGDRMSIRLTMVGTNLWEFFASGSLEQLVESTHVGAGHCHTWGRSGRRRSG